MKKRIDNHQNTPNFIMPNMGILHCFKGTMRDFSTHITPAASPVRQVLNNQDFLIIDNETGEIMKA